MATNITVDAALMAKVAKKLSWIKHTCKYCGGEFYSATSRAWFCCASHRTLYSLALTKGVDPVILNQDPDVAKLRDKLELVESQLSDAKLDLRDAASATDELQKKISDQEDAIIQLQLVEYLLRNNFLHNSDEVNFLKSAENMEIRGIKLRYDPQRKIHKIVNIDKKHPPLYVLSK